MTLIVGAPYNGFSGEQDPDFSSISFLSDTSGSKIVDVRGTVMTTVGTPALVQTESKYETGSLYCDGSLGYVSAAASSAFAFAEKDMTVEFWYKPGSKVKSYPRILNFSPNATTSGWGNADCWTIMDRHNSAPTKFSVAFYKLTGNQLILQSINDVVQHVWVHIALVRRNGVFSLFVGGVFQSQYDAGAAKLENSATNAMHIGGLYYATTDDSCVRANIEGIRLTKKARYLADFAVPAAAFSRN